ncbi:MAG TPA: glycosyltransferase [Verrucomicrobiota bacterium]|nr:glycosyltransferase [Verrucomicrobiota bacterium]
MSGIRVLHGFTFFRSLGGVESMLRLHHRVDAAHGLDSTFCAYFEPRDIGIERVVGLGLNAFSTIHTARRKFSRVPTPPAETIVYHNFWGMAFFADLDRGSRRIGVLHTDTPGLASWLRQLRGLVDGALCVSRPLLDLVRRELPELGEERTAWLPYPVAREQTEAAQQPMASRPIVLGFAGRLSFEQKRVDRFPLLIEALDQLKVDFRFEFLGDGPQGTWLKRQFLNDPRVKFHGRLSGSDYWDVLRTWDAIVFVSDYEGLPISLIEAMAVGVLPVMPSVGSGADPYVRDVREDLLYPPGKTDAAAAAIHALTLASQSEIQQLRRRANSVVEPHLGDCYERAFAQHVFHVSALPRISRSSFPPLTPRLRMFVPFGVLRRVWLGALWKPMA